MSCRFSGAQHASTRATAKIAAIVAAKRRDFEAATGINPATTTLRSVATCVHELGFIVSPPQPPRHDEQNPHDGQKDPAGKPANAVRLDRGTNHHDARVCRPIKIRSEQKSV